MTALVLAFYLGGLSVMVLGLAMRGRLDAGGCARCLTWPAQLAFALAWWAFVHREDPPTHSTEERTEE